MSATVIGDQRQTVLPADVADAAHLRPGDQVDWRFEDGEIRGRRRCIPEVRRVTASLVLKGGVLVLDTADFDIDTEEIAKAVRAERNR